MSSDREEHDMVCQRAVTLIVDLCLHNSTLLDRDTCQDFLLLLSSQTSDRKERESRAPTPLIDKPRRLTDAS
ncbi:Hypothetical protein SMAX5B_014494 [Scophthalmus maximus]|uniref:Uncharacterized protein n=1 Tax=Scophthalmus maximus TaxID=52904 RepID=A0A2U9C182_SCOMX|nr:Hypothetical protein SMAX5B_014494 [Scophthalmus maximus]